MREIFPFFYDDVLAFHIIYCKKSETTVSTIKSNLPDDLLEDTTKNWFRWLESDNPFFKKNRRRIINQLGTELLSNLKARLFFYNEIMLQSNSISKRKLDNLLTLSSKLTLKTNNYYSWSNNSFEFYILTKEFLTSRFYYPNGFAQKVSNTSRDSFEAVLSTPDMKEEYLSCYDKDTNLFYFSENEGINIYMLIEGFSPIMMVVTKAV